MIRVLDLFAGVGAFDAALDRLGVDYELVDAVEIDKYAMTAFNAIHGTNFECQDITKWDKDVGHIDIMWQSSPCQDLSVAGQGKGAEKGSGTRSSLVWEVIRIAEKIRPTVIIWENVKNLVSKKHKPAHDEYVAELEKIGYKSYWKVLNTKKFLIPQNRERVFTVSILNGEEFEFPEETPLIKRLKDVLETDVDEKFYLSQERVEKIKFSSYHASNYASRVRDPNGESRTLTARDYKDPTCVQVGVCEAINGNDILKRIYSADGVAPTCNTCGGGNTETKVVEPFIVASRGRNPDNPSDRTTGVPTEQRLEAHADGISNTLTSVLKDNYVGGFLPVKNATAKGYLEGKPYDGVYTQTGNKRGTVQPETSQTLTTREDKGVILPGLRVRKLTPREYYRLQGFSDVEFDKAAQVLSNSRLYKTAGNSVSVSVICAILSQLGVGEHKWNDMTDEERQKLVESEIVNANR